MNFLAAEIDMASQPCRFCKGENCCDEEFISRKANKAYHNYMAMTADLTNPKEVRNERDKNKY